MKYHIVYQITNIVNGKIYIGKHTTSNLDDGYMGSGKLLNKAIEKYGIENFKKHIIQIFDNEKDCLDFELFLVNEKFVNREDTYNLTKGGNGSWYHINSDLEKLRKIANNMNRKKENNSEYVEKRKEIMSQIFKILHLEGKFNYATFKGKKHTEETKKKMSEFRKGKQKGERNSQYGTCWIHHLEKKESKKIKKEELNIYIENNWIKGRKIKFN